MTTLTRKHFNLLIEAFKKSKPSSRYDKALDQWETDVEAIAEALKQTNPQFNKERFLFECGVSKVQG